MFEKFSSVEEEKEFAERMLKAANKLQAALIIESLSPNEDIDDHFYSWITENDQANPKAFRSAFDSLIEEDHTFLDKCEVNDQEALQLLKSRMGKLDRAA